MAEANLSSAGPLAKPAISAAQKTAKAEKVKAVKLSVKVKIKKKTK